MWGKAAAPPGPIILTEKCAGGETQCYYETDEGGGEKGFRVAKCHQHMRRGHRLRRLAGAFIVPEGGARALSLVYNHSAWAHH